MNYFNFMLGLVLLLTTDRSNDDGAFPSEVPLRQYLDRAGPATCRGIAGKAAVLETICRPEQSEASTLPTDQRCQSSLRLMYDDFADMEFTGCGRDIQLRAAMDVALLPIISHHKHTRQSRPAGHEA